MKIPSLKLIKTIELAARLHHGQFRKSEDNTPYVTHLYGAAMYMASITDDEDMIMAALMHDALEDVADYTYTDLVRDCDTRVADIVRGVTEDKTLPYLERKNLYIENIKTGMIESVLVSVADKIHNALSLIDLNNLIHKNYGQEFKNNQIIIYKKVLEIGEDRLKNKKGEEHKLVTELRRVVDILEGEVV